MRNRLTEDLYGNIVADMRQEMISKFERLRDASRKVYSTHYTLPISVRTPIILLQPSEALPNLSASSSEPFRSTAKLTGGSFSGQLDPPPADSRPLNYARSQLRH